MMIALVVNLIFLVLVLKYFGDIVLVVWCNWRYGVPYVPTESKLIGETVEWVKMKPGQKLVELGSGDGRVSIEFAKKYPIEVTAYEKNTWLLLISHLRNYLSWWKKGKVKFVNGDLFAVHFKGVDVVYMYLLIWMMDKLKPRLEKELKKGALVVSFDYPLKSDKFILEKLIGRGRQKMAVYRHR